MTASLSGALDAARRGGRWFFGVPVRKQTYRNFLYLLLAFPLGTLYFVFLVVGVTMSAVLLVFLIGIPLLGFTLFTTIELAAFERFLAERLLRADIPTSTPPQDVREWLWRLVFDRSPWLGAVYLFSKFVIGTVVFILLAFGITFTYTLLAAPLHYRDESVGIHLADPIEFIPVISYQHNGWTLDLVSPITIAVADGELLSVYVDSVWAALLVSGVGVLTGLVTLHLFNAFAWLYGKYTALLLRRTQRSSVGRFLIWGEDDGAGTHSREGRSDTGDGGDAPSSLAGNENGDQISTDDGNGESTDRGTSKPTDGEPIDDETTSGCREGRGVNPSRDVEREMESARGVDYGMESGRDRGTERRGDRAE